MDARLPERALTDAALDSLSDAAYRVWVAGLLYSVGQSTDGRIPERALRLLHPDGRRDDLAAELVAARVWRATSDGWQNRAYQAEQTTAADVERLREQNRERQRAYRERQRDQSVTRDDDRDVTRDNRESGNALRHAENGSDVTQMSRTENGTEPDSEPDRNVTSRVTESPESQGETATSETDPDNVTRDNVTPSVTRYTPRDRVGEARRGEARHQQQEPSMNVSHARETCPHGIDGGAESDVFGDRRKCSRCHLAAEQTSPPGATVGDRDV